MQFKGMKVSHDVPSITSVGRAPLVLPDHPVWKISEPAVALGLLEVGFFFSFSSLILSSLSLLFYVVTRSRMRVSGMVVFYVLSCHLFIPMQRELEMSTTQVDGGKHKLELLLQREVEQQQLQNHMRKSMLNSMPKMVPPQVQPLLASSGVLVWAEFLSSQNFLLLPVLFCPYVF
jgi:hypothetical protein